MLFITVDTLRASNVGAYGYAVGTTPVIDGLAAGGVRFANAVATAPETSPATASLLTGHYQAGTRVRRNGQRLPDELTTLGERARAAGWATGAIVANPLLVAEYGFDQGFAHFEHVERRGGVTDDRVANAALAWLEDAATPWFLWLHFMDPHGPPAADESWSAGFTYPPGAFGDDAPVRVGRALELGVIPGVQALPQHDRLSQYVRRYDGDVRFTDMQIGRVLDALATAGQRGRTLVVLVADHGESLTEHGELLQHGWFVYQTTLHVPLVVAWPGRLPAGRVVEARVSGIDVAPTLAELAGMAVAPTEFEGKSLVACLHDACPPREPVVALGARDNHPLALYEAQWKLVQTPGLVPPTPTEQSLPVHGFPTRERLELYAIDRDPGELHDVSAEHPERVAALRARLLAVRRRLRSVGADWYPGSSLPVDDGTTAPAPR